MRTILTATCLLALLAACPAAEPPKNLLANPSFADWADGTPAGWTVGTRPKQEVSPDETGGLRIKVVTEKRSSLSEVRQVVSVKPATMYRLRGTVSGEKDAALLQIKRLVKGKEAGRIGSKRTVGKGAERLEIVFDSADADRIAVLCRTSQKAQFVGKAVLFKDLELVELGELTYDGPEVAPKAVQTFNCIGLYWKPTGGGPKRPCHVHYRVKGSADWREALNLWFDPNLHVGAEAHSLEYRGSIVNLQPGTEYEIRLTIPAMKLERTLTCRTWDETFKIARTVTVPAEQSGTYTITEGGSEADGYVLYTPAEGTKPVWDVDNQAACNVKIDASYVIVRGLTLRGAKKHGIVLGSVHDIVIEQCDVSGWGTNNEEGYGINFHSAIWGYNDKIEKIVIQDNNLHHPRSDANSWRQRRTDEKGHKTRHPLGPQAITLMKTSGRLVIRRNRIHSDLEHMFNDAMGEYRNFGWSGFPNRDSDVAENYISHCHDEGPEIEGADMNVRVWGNYITMTYGAIAAASPGLGPLYIWRNVYAVSRKCESNVPNAFRGHFLIKLGHEKREYTLGKLYAFHNTTLQPIYKVDGWNDRGGAQSGLGITSDKKYAENLVTRNNVFHLRDNNVHNWVVNDRRQPASNDFDYDLYFGSLRARTGAQAHGINAEPTYDRAPDGRLWLRPGTPGHDAGVRIPNFNDDFVGKAPDMGAVETGSTTPKPALWPRFPDPSPHRSTGSQPTSQPAQN